MSKDRPLRGPSARNAWVQVREILPTIMGESKFAGWPCLLIRLAGCNLRCSYCDTDYAWTGGKKMSVEAVVKAAIRHRRPRVLLTGGEPLLQEHTPLLIKALIEKGFQVSLETNGSLDISPVLWSVHIVMDLKTPDSGCVKHNLLENLERLKPGDELKFVLAGRNDYLWARRTLKNYEQLHRGRRFEAVFSPVHLRLKPARLYEWIIKDRLNVRFGLQLHKYIGAP